MSGISLFNRLGDLIVRWSLTNDANGSYYEKTHFSYNGRKQKIREYVFRSGKSERERYFSAQQSRPGVFLIEPQLPESLWEIKEYSYDGSGRAVVELTSDPDGNLKKKAEFGYDAAGRLIKVSITNAKGSVEHESISIHLENPRRTETIYIRPGMEIQKTVEYQDKNGKLFKSEQFQLLADENVRLPRYRLANRMTYRYKADSTNMEWLFFRSDGSEDSKLQIVQKDGREISRLRLVREPLPKGSQNENVVPVWLPKEQTWHVIDYDRNGNVVRHEWWEQKNADSKRFLQYIFEENRTYY